MKKSKFAKLKPGDTVLIKSPLEYLDCCDALGNHYMELLIRSSLYEGKSFVVAAAPIMTDETIRLEAGTHWDWFTRKSIAKKVKHD